MRKFVVALVLVGAGWLTGATTQADAQAESWKVEVAPGLTVERIVRRGPNEVIHVARVAPGSGVALRPVLANDRVGDPVLDRQAVSDMCRRAGGILCINADFAACPTCRAPYGGLIVDGRVLRSFNPAHGQVSQVGGRLTSTMLSWGGKLAASYSSWREIPSVLGQPARRVDERNDRDELPIGGVNIDPVGNGIVLYTPDWGGTTPATPVQVKIATPVRVGPGSLAAQIVGRQQGSTPLGNDSVLAGTGDAANRLAGFADRWLRSNANEKRLSLITAVSQPASFSVGGHPVLLRDGRRQNWDRTTDPKAIGRHPRTLLGWNAAGEVLLVTADGRQPGVSDGLTLDEAADLLRSLGATEGINLDGGGSTTFVGPCRSGPCVLNTPSAGRERLVPVALAVVGDRSVVRPVPERTGPALLPPAPPAGNDDASTAHLAPVPAPGAAVPPVSGDPSSLGTQPDGGAVLSAFADAMGASRLFRHDPAAPPVAAASVPEDRASRSRVLLTAALLTAAAAAAAAVSRRRV